MIDYGTFDFEELGERGKDTIDGIRLAFHKKDRYRAIESIEILLKKGYDVYLQPMIIMNYTDEEVLELVNLANQYNIKAFYIVDSFGQMSPENVRRYFSIIDKNLKGNIMIGFHGHNNNQLAYANSLEFLSVASGREKILDCSLNGMGKGAGNLPSELIIEYLNKHHNKSYNVAELYRILVSTIEKYSDKYKWGYCPEFLLSAKYGCTPSFVSYFLSKYNVTLDELDELLSMLDEDKKTSSNSSHAEEVYQRRLKRNND